MTVESRNGVVTVTGNQTLPKFDKVDTMSKHIDSKVLDYIRRGLDIDEIILELEKTCNKFEQIMRSNGGVVDTRFKYLFTHNKVVEVLIENLYFIKDLIDTYSEFSTYSVSKLYNLVKFRDKIKGEKIKVDIPD